MLLTRKNRRIRIDLSITDPTCTDMGENPSLRGENPATNRLSCGSAKAVVSVYFH
jgi:hypothetical protein